MQPILFCFPLEIKVRDFKPRLYLGLEAIKQGRDCLIGRISEIPRFLMHRDHPFVYFDKGRAAKKGNRFHELQTLGGLIVLQEEEGGVYADEELDVSVLFHINNINNADLTLLWGSRVLDVILRLIPDAPLDKLKVTGNPRFDLCKPMFNQLHTKRFKRKIPSPYVQVNTNFDFYNIYQSLDEFINEEQNFRKDSMYNLEKISSMRRKQAEYQKQLFEAFIDVISTAARKHPKLTIVVRPHPTENIETYKKLFQGKANILVTNEGSVQEWIVGAAMVMHHSCTTAIEAFLNEKPVYSYAPILDTTLAQNLSVEISEVIKTPDEILNIFQAVAEGEPLPPTKEREKKEALLGENIANVDFNSAKRILDEVNNMLETASFPKRTIPVIPNYSKLRILLYNIKKNLFHRRKIDPVRVKMSTAKFSGLTLREVTHEVELFRSIDPELPPVHIQKVDHGTYLIQGKTN